MFRAGGQSNTGFHALTHVAWGTSLGGLVLIAEERRRRVAIAQKIVENGKKLQAYKSYGGVAAIAEFDLSRHWEADSPPHEEHILDDERSRSLTNHEWRTRRRTHKRLPTTSSELRYQSQDVAVNTIAQSQTDSKEGSRSKASIPRFLTFDHVPTLGRPIRRSTYTPSSFATPSKHPSTTYSPYTKERSRTFQDIIAGRVQQCLPDKDARFRAAGYHELSVFFRTPHKDLGRQMRQAVQQAYSMPEDEQNAHFTLNVRRNITASLQASKQHDSVVESSTDGDDVEAHDQSNVASRITAQVHDGRLDVAFFEFLALCEKATTPLSGQLRSAIKLLVKSFKKENLYSVVADIYVRGVRYLKDFELVRRRKDDLCWFLDGSTSRINLSFSKIILASLVDISDSESIGSFSATFLRWFSINAPLQDTVALLTTLDDLKLEISKRRFQLLKAATDELTQRAFRMGDLDNATDVMLWGAKRHTEALCTAGQLKVALVHLLDTGRTPDAAELYLACERRSVAKLNMKDYIKVDMSSSTGIHILNEFVRELYYRRGFDAMLSLEGAVDDRSTISNQNQDFLYRAFAEIGAIKGAMETVARLEQRDISTNSEAVQEGHAVLLRRCWKTTRNLPLIERIFNRIQSLTILSSDNHRHFDEMIRICVQAHDVERAQQYAAEMLKLGIAVTPRTMTGFMLAHAMQGEWARVKELMHSLKQQDLPATKELTADVFDYIYLQHVEQHTAAESMAFVLEIIEQFNIQPSVIMSRHTTDTIVKSEDIVLLQQWFAFLSQRGQTPWLSSEAISLLLYRISLRIDYKFHPALQTQKMLDLVQNVNNPDDCRRLLAQKLATAQEQSERTALNQPQIEVESHAESRSSAQKGMLRAMARKRPEEALAIYKNTLRGGLSPEPVNLNIALSASFMSDSEGYEEAQQLVDSAQEAGLHVTRVEEIFLAQSFKHRKLTYEDAHDIVSNHYQMLIDTHRKPSEFIAVAAARNLFLQGQNVDAQRLLYQVFSRYRSQLPFSLITMTLRLRIHIKKGHIDGVLHILTTVLERNLRIDAVFIRALQLGRQLYADNAAQHGGPDLGSEEAREAFREILVECIVVAQMKRRVQRKQSLVFAQGVVKLLKKHRD